MKDVTLFLITFTVVMVAFASGVSYIFNMASGTLATVMEPRIHPFQGPVIQQKKQYHFGSLCVWKSTLISMHEWIFE